MDICLRKRLWPVANQRHITVDPVSRSAPVDTVRCIVVLLSVARKNRPRKRRKRNGEECRCAMFFARNFLQNKSRNLGVLRTNRVATNVTSPYSRDAHGTYVFLNASANEDVPLSAVFLRRQLRYIPASHT